MKVHEKPIKRKRPYEPLKPRQPLEPQKTITLFKKVELGTVDFGNTTLGDITRQIENLLDQKQLSHDNTIFFRSHEERYEVDVLVLYCVVGRTVENKHYNREYNKYVKEFAAYELACKAYEDAMIAYAKQLKEYEAAELAQQLSEKQRYMQKLEKDIQKLKKQISDA